MNISPLIEQLKQKNFRITKARRHLLQALSEGPLTMMELAQYMQNLGHPNVQTIYNNIHTLEKEHIIFTTLKDHTKYYHLVGQTQKASTQINIRCHDNKGVFFIEKKEIIQQLKKLLGIDTFQIDHLDITIQGQCQYLNDPHCELQQTCAIQQLKHLSH